MSTPKKTRPMTSALKQYQGIHSVAVTGNDMPRRCGIAAFTTDSVEGLVRLPNIDIYAAAMNDRPKGYPYTAEVRIEISQNKLNDYGMTPQFFNIGQTDVVCFQNEDGLFSSPTGGYLL